MRGYAVAIAVLAAVAAILVPLASDDGDAALTDDYPDADIIISQGTVSTLVVTYVDSEGKTSTQTYSAGSDLELAKLSDIDGSLSVVMASGTVGSLTLVDIDDASAENTVDIDFLMVSGSASEIVAVSSSVSLPSSYSSAFNAVGTLTMDIRGDVTELCTTTCMVGIGTLSISVGSGSEIDRLYPTGEDGTYGEVTLVLEGGDVGYLTNRSAVVSYMTYELRAGSVRYLCLGADSEGGSSILSGLWTFYVQVDASFYISSAVTVGRAVLGSGLTDIPSILCNGESPSAVFSRNIVIDAPAHTIAMDSCFYSGTSSALSLSGYVIGGTVNSQQVSSSCYVPSYGSSVPTYGDGGIWTASRGGTVEAGTALYVGCCLTVASGAELDVAAGGLLVNSGIVSVSGVMNSSGTVVNNGYLEEVDSGSVDAEFSGTGYLATCIYTRTTDGRIDVMTSEYSAVVLRYTGDSLTFSSATVRLTGVGAVIVVSSDSDMSGTLFTAAVGTADAGSYLDAWTVSVGGFGSSVSVQVTMAVEIPEGYRGRIVDSTGAEMEVLSYTESSIVFAAEGSGTYYFETVSVDADEIAHRQLVLNSAIAAAIVIVAAVAVYFLLRHDRGRGPA